MYLKPFTFQTLEFLENGETVCFFTLQVAIKGSNLGYERIPWTERSPPELDFVEKHHGSSVADLLYLDRSTKPTHGKASSEKIVLEKVHKYGT